MIDKLEKMLAAGNDSALLRFSLGNAYLGSDPAQAALHLSQAVIFDPQYSAAWKLLGRAHRECGDAQAAALAFRQGIEVAQARGDIQAVKEMQVFLRRLDKAAGGADQD